MTQMGGVVVEVSLKVAATKSSVTMALKKICDTCVRGRVRVSVRNGVRLGVRVRVRIGVGANLLVAQVALVLLVHLVRVGQRDEGVPVARLDLRGLLHRAGRHDAVVLDVLAEEVPVLRR